MPSRRSHRRTYLSLAASSVGVAFAGCLGDETDEADEADEASEQREPTTSDDADDDVDGDSDSGDAQPDATLHTSRGNVEVDLYDERAPRTVDNFVGLATGARTWIHPETGETVEGEPLYDDVLFHRVVEGFVIQTGDPTGTGYGGPGYRFDDEVHPELRHDSAGVLSMANSGPDTNGSQFFITLAPVEALDGGYSVFGRVTAGMDVVDEIGSLETDDAGRPREDVLLESVTIHG